MSFGRATRRGLTTAAVLLAALAGASAASAASPENRASARQHLSQAEELKKKGHLAEACKHLQEGERLDPQLPTLLELAECTEQLGKLVEAQDLWSAARDQAKHDEKPQSKARAEARLAAIQKRVAHLTLELAANAPAGAQVLRDDVTLEPASLASALATDPGDHVVLVKVAGHDDAKYSVKLAEGDHQTLAIAAGPLTSAQSSPPPSPAPPLSAPPPTALAPMPDAEASKQPPPPSPSWWSARRTAGVIAGSAGLVGIGLGSALFIVGSRDASKRGAEVDQRVAFGGMSLASGGALLVTAVVFLAGASSTEAPEHARMTVKPTLLLARSTTVLGAAGEF